MYNRIRPLALRRCALAAIALAVLGFSGTASADFINIQSVPEASSSNLGTFVGSIDYAFDPIDNDGRLIITLTNTSPAANGGFITGFVFNIDSADSDASATLVSATPNTFLDAPNQNGQPFGNPYDAGAALGGMFQGGPNPQDGLGVGETGTFEFEVNASDAATLTAIDFINGPYEYDFLVRFRGFDDGGSDRVPAEEGQIPGPSALLAACFGVLLFRSRRRLA